MKLKYFLVIMLITTLLTNTSLVEIYSESKKNEDIIKIGLYEYEPYVNVDSNGNISGYYVDLLKLLTKRNNLKYEYVICDIADGLKKVEDGSIDIMLGIPILTESIGNLIFNKYTIAKEKFAIFANEGTDLNKLENLGVVRLGLVEADYNADWIFRLFKSTGANVEVTYGKSYEYLERLIEEEKIDIMVDSAYKKTNKKNIYQFVGHQVYIVGNKDSKDILSEIDKSIIEHKNSMYRLYYKYFDKSKNILLYEGAIILGILFLLILFRIFYFILPRIKKNIMKRKIRYRIENNEYLLQYQPIYNPRNKNIVAFEGLLRLIDKNGKLVQPNQFIPEIEKNDMLFDVSIWILKKAIEDYKQIKEYECMCQKDFYISINLSLNEIENEDFVKKATEILIDSNLGSNKICLEIIERVKANDLDKIIKNISFLKKSGFKIAIDDFGVEYSNLDVLQKLDIDTIKVDKSFVDDICKDEFRYEIVLFVSRIAKLKNKYVVLEGIEEQKQDIIIKEIDNNQLYVQGYYYNKPMYIEDIELL